jgi:hypothetical protein
MTPKRQCQMTDIRFIPREDNNVKWKRVRIIVVAGVFLVLAALACSPNSETSVPSIAISSPVSGSAVIIGEEVQIVSTAAADAGVEQVDLAINGQTVRSDTPPSGNPSNFTIAQAWMPTEEGVAIVTVVVYDTKGARSDQATISLNVVASGAVVPTDGSGTVVPPGSTEMPLPPVTTESGCTLDSQYVADMTIPDGTVMNPGQAFVKTWRVRNSGTCDWDEGYELVFASGEQMDGPTSAPLPAVAAGGEADVSANLTAPSAYGTHKGTWRIRAEDGTVFGTNLTAVIEVPPPVTDTPTPTSTPEPTAEPVDITLSTDSQGSVDSQGTLMPAFCFIGDSHENQGVQCFVTFDLSAIPDSAIITEASLEYRTTGQLDLGDPFGDLGVLSAYLHSYGTLSADDYAADAHGSKKIHANLMSSDYLGRRIQLEQAGFEALRDSLESDQFQFRLQFRIATDVDYEADHIHPTVTLRVRYRP